MVLTQAELDSMLQRNPNLRISEKSGKWRSERPAQIFGDMVKSGDALIKADSKKTAKYWNIKVYVQERGHSIKKSDPSLGSILAVYDSIKEFQRKRELDTLVRALQISELERQVPLIIQEDFSYGEEKIAAIVYRADFVYKDQLGQTCVEDVKGFDENTGKYRTTKDFDLKWKLLKAKYPDYKFVLYQLSPKTKGISDASWGEFRRQLEYKAEWYGKSGVAINRFFPSSQLGHVCGAQWPGTKDLEVREGVTCPSCGANHNRDVNAAINILVEGLRISA